MRFLRVGYATFAAFALVGAGSAMIGLPTGAGMWEVSDNAAGLRPQRVCLADPMLLAQWEHRAAACTRVVISARDNETAIHYTCVGGGFGRSDLTMLTPRSLRIETQGISDGLPFDYVLHARRVGDCSRALSKGLPRRV